MPAEIDSPDLVALRQPDLAPHNGPPDEEVAGIKLHVSPLQSDQFASSEARSNGAKQ